MDFTCGIVEDDSGYNVGEVFVEGGEDAAGGRGVLPILVEAGNAWGEWDG